MSDALKRASGIMPGSAQQRESGAGMDNARARQEAGGTFKFIVQAARPGFWLTAIWFYLLPVAQRPIWNSFDFWLGVFFISFPFGLLIYGWNDIVDRENDRRNPRKGSFLFGSRGSDEQLRKLPWVIALVHLPFVIWFTVSLGMQMLVWYAALIAATALYNWPRFGFKNFPAVDVLNQAAYLLVFYVSSAVNHVPQLPWQTMLFGVMFAMHSHLLGEVMDLEPDRAAGRRTTALVLGAVPTKLLIALFLAVEATLVNHAFGDRVITTFLACGAGWFVFDSVCFRARPYPDWLPRLFLLGWNVMALASAWYVWSSGALSRRS
jgi:4-hydroxybenzoate polyprenyltransferase